MSSDSKEYKQTEAQVNILHEDSEAYENLEITRRKQAILSTDSEKFKLFTKLMRISLMLRNAKVTHKKMIE